MEKLVRNIVGSRLVYYRSDAGSHYWDDYWQKRLNHHWYARYDRGNLLYFEDVFLKYLPLTGRILEAGCGLGQIVMALRYRGYDCEGVEWADRTVEAVRQLYPELPIRSGDVTHLNVPDACYDAIISLGVVEHRFEGPEPYLEEAQRILSPDGVLLISVPFFNALRQARGGKGRYCHSGEGYSFFQYAFREEEMIAILTTHGFIVREIYPYDFYLGIKEELPVFQPILAIPHMSFLINTLLKHWQWGRQRLSHMVMFVCEKNKEKQKTGE